MHTYNYYDPVHDVPLAKAAIHNTADNELYKRVLNLIRNLLSETLKTNEYLYKAILTGCLRVAKESIFTGLNNLVVDTVLNCNAISAKSFGFTQSEVDELLTYYELSHIKQQVKNWYDGYRFANEAIYCPWDMISFCNDAVSNPHKPIEDLLSNYWINTSGNAELYQFLGYLDETDTHRIQQLIDRQSIELELNETLNYIDLNEHHSEDFWTLLTYTGYLTVTGRGAGDNNLRPYLLAIPNTEIRLCFESNIKNYFAKDKQRIKDREQLLSYLFNADFEQLRLSLEKLLRGYISIRDTATKSPPENYYLRSIKK